MSNLTLTKTQMRDGTWQGIVTGADDTKPDLAVTHADAAVSYTHLTLPTIYSV